MSLIQRMVDCPEDREPYDAFAESLGWDHPHAQLISAMWDLEQALSLGSETSTKIEILKSEIADLMELAEPFVLGSLFDELKKTTDWDHGEPKHTIGFRRGFLDELLAWDMHPDFAQSLAEYPYVGMLSNLSISDLSFAHEYYDQNQFLGGGWENHQTPSIELLAQASFSNLRQFCLIGELSASSGIEKLISQMPKLEIFETNAHQIDATAVAMCRWNRLRELSMSGFLGDPLALLGSNSTLTHLEKLDLEPRMDEVYPFIDNDSLAVFCQSVAAQNLVTLKLECTHFGDRGIQTLLESGVLSRLTRLDLGYGAVTDVGASLIMQHGTNLKTVGLDFNYLSPAMVESIYNAFENVSAVSQYTGDPESSNSHLWEHRFDLYG